MHPELPATQSEAPPAKLGRGVEAQPTDRTWPPNSEWPEQGALRTETKLWAMVPSTLLHA